MSSPSLNLTGTPVVEIPEISEIIPASLRRRADLQWWRKILHLHNGTLGICLYLFSGMPEWGVWLFLSTFILGGAIFDFVRNRDSAFNNRALRLLRPVIRDNERYGMNSMTKGLLGILFVLFFFPRRVDVPIMFFMAYGDPIGAIIGRFFGSVKLNAHCSLEGTFAVFLLCGIFSWLGLTFFLPEIILSGGMKLLFAACAGLIGAFSEGAFPQWDDNLTIPLISAPLLYGLYMLFGY